MRRSTDYDISLGVERAGEELKQQRHAVAGVQGLTLIHFSAQLRHVLWHTMCLWVVRATRDGSS